MAFTLPPLPYSIDALAPHISRETLELHHGKHHAAYVKKLNELVSGTRFANLSLRRILEMCPPGPLHDNAAQHFNHSFYWQCLKPANGDEPSSALGERIRKAFGGFDKFRSSFSEAAVGQFGSGWAWLVMNPDGALAVEATMNADAPIGMGKTPLLACDVWEHAYYLDYRNDRGKYLEAFWNLVNWEFVATNIMVVDAVAAVAIAS